MSLIFRGNEFNRDWCPLVMGQYHGVTGKRSKNGLGEMSGTRAVRWR